MPAEVFAVLMILLPLLAAIVCMALKTIRGVGYCVAGGVSAAAACALLALTTQPAGLSFFNLDALASFHLMLLYLIFVLSTAFAWGYFKHEIAAGELERRGVRRFGALWLATLGALSLTLSCANLGLMWVGMEATTLATAFLISLHGGKGALEAMWKYLMLCSVGIALAFIGVLLLNAASTLGLSWKSLMAAPGRLNPGLLKVSFVFVMIGYGTKAGLAPMHNWLPDAHSQAPAPVSAMFSGFMLNAALYCILRHAGLTNAALGSSAFTAPYFLGFGLISLMLAAAFLIFQRDLKRLLAYCSVEHLGLICLGLGLGPLGTFAALLHTLNHSLAKASSFFSAGRLVQHAGSRAIQDLRGSLATAPTWGLALVASLLALAGCAPLAPFISELLLVKAALATKQYLILALMLVAMLTAFVAMLYNAIELGWAPAAQAAVPACITLAAKVFYLGLVFALLALGLWLPPELMQGLNRAARIAGGLP
ncbi:MAG: Hydrogenase-4 component B [Deltaproteobacteria bacterium ADurb.Bin510]|nr:MAG: Hydrogenase-4 component B [Deltaproteobacteria bacterium ADurb.Bin510]